MQRTAGSSLVESLVALAVFAMGSAITGAWLARSAAVDAGATRSAIATTLALSLEVRMRANPVGLAHGHYAYPATLAANCARGCDAVAIAAADVAWFRRALAEQLATRAPPIVHCTPHACTIRVVEHARTLVDWTFAR